MLSYLYSMFLTYHATDFELKDQVKRKTEVIIHIIQQCSKLTILVGRQFYFLYAINYLIGSLIVSPVFLPLHFNNNLSQNLITSYLYNCNRLLVIIFAANKPLLFSDCFQVDVFKTSLSLGCPSLKFLIPQFPLSLT